MAIRMSEIGAKKRSTTKSCARPCNSLEEQIGQLLEKKIGESVFVKDNIIGLINNIAKDINLKDIEFFRMVEEACLDDLEKKESSAHSFAINLIIECSGIYYEGIGFHKKELELKKLALSHALRINDVGLQRRAHNCLSTAYIRLCDFKNACFHSEQAYLLANKSRNPFFVFATLVNAVAVVENMGLLQSALNLAMRIKDQPQGDIYYDHLHLINANNGMRISHILGDNSASAIFYVIASRKIRKAHGIATEVTKAYFEVGRATHLAKNGYSEKALLLINKALKRNLIIKNERVQLLLLCAQANMHLALSDEAQVVASRKKLVSILENTPHHSVHYEELLKTLIKSFTIHGAKASSEERKQTLRYLRILREYVIAIKHRHFFSAVPNMNTLEKEEVILLKNPSYTIPAWIVDNNRLSGGVHCDVSGMRNENSQLQKLPLDIAEIAGGNIEKRLRSREYDIAENWVVAAEFSIGNDGRHSYRVGKVAAAIAAQLGYSVENATRVELACRLHNIGNAAIAFSSSEFESVRPLGQFSLVCEHTIAGERLLSASADDILRLGAIIAKSHHEWWNGCGYPKRLKREVIPIEARICAVADTFIALIRPVKNAKAWEIDKAMEQIKSMAGFQLDPGLIHPLSRVADQLLGEPSGRYCENVGVESENQLIIAKTRLFELLELSDAKLFL